MFKNDSILNDDIISHRIGLVPLRINPNKIMFQNNKISTQKNTIVFQLKHVNLSYKTNYAKNVFSKDLKISPYGSKIPYQSLTFFSQPQNFNLLVSYNDILFTKLKPRQTIFLEAHCKKSYPTSHAKFSPVTACWFTQCNFDIFIKNFIYYNHSNRKLNNTYISKNEGMASHYKFYRNCNYMFNCDYKSKMLDSLLLLNEKFINIQKKKHYLFSIETVGTFRPEYLFLEAIFKISKKIERIKIIT